MQCPSTPDLFGLHVGRVCVGLNSCPIVSGAQYYADDTTRTCVPKCPLNRWADTIAKTCVQDCPNDYLRDSVNQLCVQNCPSNPELFADTNLKNCVAVCPNNSYAVINGTNFRLCANDCGLYNLIKDNVTNRCVANTACPTEPYMYGNQNAGTCVL